MTLFDFLWHVLNLLAPAVGLAGLTVLLAKLVWWRRLKAAAWGPLLGWAAVAAAAASLAGLVIWGRDGAMYTYAAMVVATAVAVLLTGFGRRGGD